MTRACRAGSGAGPRAARSPRAGEEISGGGVDEVGQLAPGGDAEFLEDLAKVVVDRVGAEEHGGADLGVGVARCGEAGDGQLLDGEVQGVRRPGGRGAVADGLQLDAGPTGERRSLSALEEVDGPVQVLARVPASPAAPEPLAIQEVSTGEFDVEVSGFQRRER